MNCSYFMHRMPFVNGTVKSRVQASFPNRTAVRYAETVFAGKDFRISPSPVFAKRRSFQPSNEIFLLR
jgi:hypothetical protein